MSVNMLGEAMIRAGQSLREGLDNQHKGLTRIAEALERIADELEESNKDVT